MSWIKLTMKFPGTCMICNGKIAVNEPGLWQKGVGVKHEECAKSSGLDCAICGGPAGCNSCEFRDDCDLERVSQSCICNRCSAKKDAFLLYGKSVSKKFPVLNLKI